MKRLFVNFKSSLLLMIICKCTKHYNYLETHLHLILTYLRASKLLKAHMYRPKVIKMPSLLKLGLNEKRCIILGLMKWRSHYTNIFQVSFRFFLF